MRLTLLGTGCPQCSPLRLGPANLVRAGGRHFLVDCGSGVSQRLVAAGSSGSALDAVFLTHLHSDHVIDLYQLIISSWHQGRDRPHHIIGPPGSRRFVEAMMATWAEERQERIAFEKRSSTAAFEIRVDEIGAGEVYRDGDFCVEAVRVDHQPVKHAFGFIFRTAGATLVFSGDTRFWPPLIEASREADVLVHEVFIHREMGDAVGTRTAEGLRNVQSYHTLSTEVGKVAREAGVGTLILNHFVPVMFDKARLLEEVRRDYGGPVIIGEDLLSYDLATRTLAFGDLCLGLPIGGAA